MILQKSENKVSKTGYRFKVLFRIRRSTFVDEAPRSMLLTTDGDKAEIKLRIQGDRPPDSESGTPGRPDEMRQFIIVGEPYESGGAARNAAANAKKAILVLSATQNFGVDFYSGLASEPSIEELEAAYLNVYAELYPAPLFPLQTFADFFSKSFHSDRCNAKQLLALEIYATSHFDRAPMSQFVSRVTALEALMEQKVSSVALKEWIAKLRELSRAETSLDDEDRNQILNALGGQKNESKTRAGQRLAGELLPNKTYANLTAPEVFKKLYSVRSTIVHTGHHEQSTEKEFQALCELCGVFVSDMLVASIRHANKRSLENLQ